MTKTKKNDQKAKLDAIGCADRCEAAAIECGEALGTLAATFKEAAQMLRKMHGVLADAECQHMFTFKVTKDMNEKGVDDRNPGKYCMTCGERIEKKAAAATDSDETHDEDAEEESGS